MLWCGTRCGGSSGGPWGPPFPPYHPRWQQEQAAEPAGVQGGGRREFGGLKQEDQQPIFNSSFECEVSLVLKKAPGK